MPKLLRVMALVFLFGCPVQEPTPSRPDFGVTATPDGGLDCTQDSSLCVRGERCEPATRRCVANTTCTGHGDCAADRRCVDGVCGQTPGHCAGPADCAAEERCAPSGICLRDWDESGRLLPVCSLAAACTLGTSCQAGVCEPCTTDLPCPGAQVCRLGRCEEPVTCRGAEDCFAGHACTAGLCVRPTVGCQSDPENDVIGGATALLETYQSGFELCGLDRDWYSLRLDPFVGARIIITSEASSSGAFADLETRVSSERGEAIGDVTLSRWPGRTIIEVPGRDDLRDLRLSISSNQNTRYAIDAERIFGLCAGDFVDLLGDTADDAPPVSVRRLGELELRACPNDLDHFRVALSEDDLVSFALDLDSSQGARLGLRVDDGTGRLFERSFTATVSAPLTLPRALLDAELLIRVRGDRAPELGADYRWLADVETAARYQACLAPAIAPSSATLVLSTDGPLGYSSCGADARFQSERALLVQPVNVPTLLRATVRPVASTSAKIGVRLLGECARDSSERSCDASPRAGLGASIEQVLTSTAPVFLIVSTSEPGTPVEFELGFDQPDNFTCIGGRSEVISSSGLRTVSTVEATRSFELEDGSLCGPAGVGSGPDRFFELEVAARQVVVLELSGRPDGFLWVGTTCARMSETCTAAASIDDIASPARVILEPSRATRYVVSVDGYSGDDAGDYELRTLFSPECLNDAACRGGERCDDYVCSGPPPNDQCPGTSLALAGGTALASGSTAAGTDDFDSEVCPGGADGNDVVFQLELLQPVSALTARVPRATFDPLIYVRRNLCESPQAELGCNDDEDLAVGNLLPRVELTNVAAGVYYLIVDAYSFGNAERGGTFDLEVTVTP